MQAAVGTGLEPQEENSLSRAEETRHAAEAHRQSLERSRSVFLESDSRKRCGSRGGEDFPGEFNRPAVGKACQ
jgi:hypothetical protein